MAKRLDRSTCNLYGDGPRATPHCARWGPSSTKRGTALPFSAHVRCGQTAGWTKMPFGKDVGRGPGHTVLNREPAPQRKGGSPQFRPMSVVAKRLDGSRCHLVCRYARVGPGDTVLDGDSAPPKGHNSPFSAYVCCGQTVTHLSNC